MTVTQRPPIQCLLVDLDDTLYNYPEIGEQCAANIREYMLNRLHIPKSEVDELCRELYMNYGTTCAGLVASGYKIDYDDWHEFVHGTLPYDEYLRPDPKLKSILDSIPVAKFIFTNADIRHAERCLDILGLRSCFQDIICFESIMEAALQQGLAHKDPQREGQIAPVICKPNRHAFHLALKQADNAEIATTAFFDDSTRNITSAHKMGIFSVLVGRVGVECFSDEQMKSMHDVHVHLPWLMDVCDGRPPSDHLAGVGLASPRRAEDVSLTEESTAITVPA